MADVVTSSERLAEIQARRERITPGPWSFYRDDLWCGATAEELQRADDIYAQPDVYFSDEAEEIFERAEHVFHGDPVCPTDAEFIAAAPADVDWLLAEVERLNERIDDLNGERLSASRVRAALSAAEARVERLETALIEAANALTAMIRSNHSDDAPWMRAEANGVQRRLAAALAPGKPQPTEEER